MPLKAKRAWWRARVGGEDQSAPAAAPLYSHAAAAFTCDLRCFRRECETSAVSAVTDAIEIDEAAFRGHVVRPGDPDYDLHRKIWNGSFDRRPAVIVRCAGVSDVIAAVKLGRASGLPVAVRSGGHSFPGLSVADDALVIDLSPMKGVRVDPERARRACRRASCSASSTGRRRRSGSRCRPASSRTPAWRG